MLTGSEEKKRSQLLLPDDMSVDAFLYSLDSRPRLIPSWPQSEHMTLVGLVGSVTDGDCRDGDAFVITKPVGVDALIDFRMTLRDHAVLFFTVLRSRVLPYCQLDQTSWE